jgi:hypothetical protein
MITHFVLANLRPESRLQSLLNLHGSKNVARLHTLLAIRGISHFRPTKKLTGMHHLVTRILIPFFAPVRFSAAAVAPFEAKIAVPAIAAPGAAQEPSRDCGHGQPPAILPSLTKEIDSAPVVILF